MSKLPTQPFFIQKQAQAKTTQTPLEKAKKEFAQLLNRIEKLKQEAEARDTNLTDIRRRITQEIQPLMKQIMETRLAMNDLLERKIAQPDFNRREKRTLTELLFYNCDLLEQLFGQDMTELKRKYMTKRELRDMEHSEAMQDVLDELFGEAFDQSDKSDTFTNEDYEADAHHWERKRQRKKKGAGPESVEPAVKRKLDLQRYIRSLYLSLVKRIHPDLEQQEERKIQRTNLMQKVTAAYQKLDLYELLKAQKDLLDLEASEPEQSRRSLETEQAELEQLRQYTRILKSQEQEIQSDYLRQSLLSPDAALLRTFYHPSAPHATDKAFDKQKKQLKKEIKRIQELQKVLNREEEARVYLEMMQNVRSLEGYF